MNLTEKANLVINAEGYGGRARHHQVVYRQTSRREEWVATLADGEIFRPNLLQRTQKHVVYEVNAEPEIRHTFGQLFQTHDEIHDFTLDFTLFYWVDDARLLVESMSRDPLRQLEKYAYEWIGGAARHLPWEVLWAGGAEFRQATQRFVDPSGAWVSVKDGLNEKARVWGLGVLRLGVTRVLPPNAVSPDEKVQISRGRRAKESVAGLHHDAKVEQVKKELKGKQDEIDINQRLRLKAGESLESVIAMMGNMIDRAGAKVDSFPEMLRAVRQLQDVRDEVARLTQPLVASQMTAALPSNSVPALSASLERTPSRWGLGSILDDIQVHLSDLPAKARREILPPIFSLLAELVRDSEGDLEQAEDLAENIHGALENHHSGLGGHQIDAIRRLANLTALRKKLSIKEVE